MANSIYDVNDVEDVYGLAGNPLFAYQQGLMTPQMLLDYIKQITSTTVMTPEEYDYQSIEAKVVGYGDELLPQAFAQIKSGMSIYAVKRWLFNQFSNQGQEPPTAQEQFTLDNIEAELEEYEKRWNNSIRKDSKIESGEWLADPATGNIIGPMTEEEGSKVLRGLGLPGLLSMPSFYQTIPNQEYVQKAIADEVAAEASYNQWQKLDTALRKSATSQAQQAYELMKFNKEGAGSKGRAAYELSTFAPSVASRAAANPPVAPVAGQKKAEQAKPAPKTAPRDNSNEAILARMSPQEREYWAKMSQSYAGRGALSEGTKPGSAIAQKKSETDRLISSMEKNKQMSIETGYNPALAAISMASLMGSQELSSAPRYVTPQPRVLSDQEIETMATMIAGGFSG